MMASHKNNCLECSRKVSKITGLKCSTCEHPVHPRCSKLSKKEYVHFQKYPNLNTYICDYCQFYKCGKCGKAVHKVGNALQCEGDGCGTWFHLKCTKITLEQYNEFNTGVTAAILIGIDVRMTMASSMLFIWLNFQFYKKR